MTSREPPDYLGSTTCTAREHMRTCTTAASVLLCRRPPARAPAGTRSRVLSYFSDSFVHFFSFLPDSLPPHHLTPLRNKKESDSEALEK